MNRRWLLLLIPALLGLIFYLVLGAGLLPDPLLHIRMSFSYLGLFTGLIVTIFLLAIWEINRFRQWRYRYQKLVQSHAADERRRFLRRLDHELKNPLTAIRAGLANISEAPSETSRQEAIESVEAQALRLSRLSADLRKLAELETRPLEQSRVNIVSLLQEVFNLAQDQSGADERHLTLTLPQAPWPIPAVSGDADLLFLAIHNLMDNAIKFTHPGNTIELRAFEDESNVVIEVADTGPGIPPEDLAHVWEELYRGQGARPTPGSGLGLALVRAIAERHDGLATVRSRVAQGSVFTLRLPVARSE
ncbi:MAG: HAMP domain-containing sensor histidine kinase [Anaerolineales bacterium]